MTWMFWLGMTTGHENLGHAAHLLVHLSGYETGVMLRECQDRLGAVSVVGPISQTPTSSSALSNGLMKSGGPIPSETLKASKLKG